jgi:hypothetical protein
MSKLPKPHLLLCFVFGLSLLAGCGAGMVDGKMEKGLQANGREVVLGEDFKLEKDEKVSVKDTNMTIQLKSVRRTWYVDGKSETADADIVITLDGKEQRRWMKIGDKLTFGDYMVELSGADPFGKTNAGLIIKRS